MEHWYGVETQRRRDDLYAQAAHARILRMLESGRSSGVRDRIADGAESLGSLLTNFARVMRNHEA
jgi:hypothetical protein